MVVPGMVMMATPIVKAAEKALKGKKGKRVIVWFSHAEAIYQ